MQLKKSNSISELGQVDFGLVNLILGKLKWLWASYYDLSNLVFESVNKNY